MTIVELLLALGITAMVGAAVLSMLLVVSGGTQLRDDMRRRNVKTQVVGQRLDAEIRSAAMVLAADNNMLVLWMGDHRQTQRPNLSELRRIEWDADAKAIFSYAAPAGLSDADDIAFDLTDDFAEITQGLKGGGSFVEQTWAEGVAGWQVGPAGANQDTRMIHYTLTLETPEVAVLASMVSLRGR